MCHTMRTTLEHGEIQIGDRLVSHMLQFLQFVPSIVSLDMSKLNEF